jgi:hypothetical protein
MPSARRASNFFITSPNTRDEAKSKNVFSDFKQALKIGGRAHYKYSREIPFPISDRMEDQSLSKGLGQIVGNKASLTTLKRMCRRFLRYRDFGQKTFAVSG